MGRHGGRRRSGCSGGTGASASGRLPGSSRRGLGAGRRGRPQRGADLSRTEAPDGGGRAVGGYSETTAPAGGGGGARGAAGPGGDGRGGRGTEGAGEGGRPAGRGGTVVPVHTRTSSPSDYRK
ncbi:hypothetical protein CRV15_15510 [Streptomyces clavuligerus]|nr:hypothetical protein CRV15_15510 [Streptomyces clavuligerus]